MEITYDHFDKESLWDLVAVMTRYNLDRRCLAALCNPDNESWFKDPNKFWYRAIFGSDAVEAPADIIDPGLTAAAKVIHAAGRHYHWFDGEYDSLDKIGRSEFDGIIQSALGAADAARATANKKS